MRLKALTILLPLLAVWLCGFKFIQPPRKWNEADMPIEYYVGEDSPAGMTEDEAREILVDSHANWANVDCSPLRFERAGTIPNEPTFGRSDRTQVTFQGNLESGVLAAAVTHASSNVLEQNGNTFFQTTAYNIIFNSGPAWGTPEYIGSPDCFGRYSYLSTSTHEIGHGLGLGHSCDDGEPCPDPIKRNATMYWSGQRCEDDRDDPNEDDAAGINSIYGVAVDFDVVSPETSGTVGTAPMTVVVSVPDEFQIDRFLAFEWNFGDGSDLVMLDADDPALDGLEHTYTEEGQYTITLTAFGDDESCGGEFETFKRQVGAVLACSPPQPSAEFVNEGDFTVQMVNTSPLGAFGCTTEYEWILDGDESTSLSTYEPQYVFESAGTHTITLRAAGPGGENTADFEITVTRNSDVGCNASVTGRGSLGLGGLLALLGLAGLVRRRS
ncbi:MAG: PKD domain-containing protein [Proteobacteria bacterium]|nr:PKD domain-containing protein [Pseudomonadota bacterium]